MSLRSTKNSDLEFTLTLVIQLAAYIDDGQHSQAKNTGFDPKLK